MSLERFLKKTRQIKEEIHRKQEPPSRDDSTPHDEGNWLVSYADMMTLLCAFFIMMFSMAKLNAPDYEKVRKEVAKQFGGDVESQSDKMAKFVTQIINDLGIEKEVLISSDPYGVSIVFESTVLFGTLSAYIREPGRNVLKKLIQKIQERQFAERKEYRIVVEGHTDSRPVISGRHASNWELSGARASRVVRMFKNFGFSSDHLLAIGYGDSRPRSIDRKPSGEWDSQAADQNRRVVIRILEPQVDHIPWEQPQRIQSHSDPATKENLPDLR